MCELCQGPVSLDDVYLFPCYHAFHTQCLTDEVCGRAVPYAWQRVCSSSFSAIAPAHTPPTLLAHPANSKPVSLPPAPPPPLLPLTHRKRTTLPTLCIAQMLGHLSAEQVGRVRELQELLVRARKAAAAAAVAAASIASLPSPGARARSGTPGAAEFQEAELPRLDPAMVAAATGSVRSLLCGGVRAFEAQCFCATMARPAHRRTSIVRGVGKARGLLRFGVLVKTLLPP